MAERLAASRLAAASAPVRSLDDSDRASLPARSLAYVLDSIVLFGFTMLFAAVAGLNLFLRSNGGEDNITDADQWTTAGLLVLAMPAWLLLNLLLTAARGHTIGQYVMGLRIVREDGRRAGMIRLLAYWLSLHPLLFHPMFGGGWLLLAGLSLLSDAAFILCGALAGAVVCRCPLRGVALGGSRPAAPRHPRPTRGREGSPAALT
jgi:uncharacterized RDD family membrane protein YckC